MQDAVTTRDVAGPRPGTWSLAVSGIAVVCFVALLALAWLSASTLLLIFAGILLAVFLDGLTRILGSVLPLRRGWRLALVSLVLAGLAIGLVGYGGAMLVQQARDLGRTVQEQSGTVRDWLKSYGIDSPALESLGAKKPDTGSTEPPAKPQAEADVKSQNAPAAEDAAANDGNPPSDRKPRSETAAGASMPNASSILGPASNVVLALFNALGNVLVIIFLGIACAADPGTYRDGLLRFVPPQHRPRGTMVLDGMGETLRHWLFGQLITMVVIFLCTWAGLAVLGIGGALILGLQAGLLAFIPTIGPLIAGVVIVLASLASGTNAALGAIGVYVAVQTLETYGLTPFIQKRALDIPEATIFAGQLILGVLFGLWGVALALPLTAVIKVLLDQLYIEETLHEDAGA
jgi:predicted PurR-regulated permease PerM